MDKNFNNAHIYVMRMFLYDQECWGKIFGVHAMATILIQFAFARSGTLYFKFL